MLIDIIRIGLLLLVTFIYAVFDVFNKREVPDLFVYGSIVLGGILLLTYGTTYTIVFGLLVAIIIAMFGYLLYREGWLGAGDFLEFVFIALVMPMQIKPLFVNFPQFTLPFIFSVFISAGFSVSIFVPLYYLFFVKKNPEEDKMGKHKPRYFHGAAALVLYAGLLAVVGYFFFYNIYGILLILLIAIPSTFILIYEKTIYLRMVSFIYPKELTDGDMIAVTLMNKNDVDYYKKKSSLFGRLATKKLITAIKKEKRKLPVYRNAVPFALFIFIGVVVSLLLGNIILLILF